jgi:D-inositol-3-phosphate glycosyltransferase
MHTMALVKNANLADGDVPEPMSRVIGEEQVVAEADMLIASTQEEADDLVIAYGADRARVRVVPPGVDLGTFRPPASPQERDALRARLGLDPARPVIVFAGRLQPLKGPDLLVRALGLMRRRSSSEAAGRAASAGSSRRGTSRIETNERVETRGACRDPLLVVLGGPSGRRTALAELRALAWQEGVLDDVRFLEPMTHDRLADWYRAADVVAVPSHSESFGLVALEAQAAGTPVVAAAVGGLRTVVADGRSGLLVPGHDPQRWADALGGLLGRLAHEPGTRAGLAAGARAQAERFTWDATAEGTLSAYRDARTRMPRRGAG